MMKQIGIDYACGKIEKLELKPTKKRLLQDLKKGLPPKVRPAAKAAKKRPAALAAGAALKRPAAFGACAPQHGLEPKASDKDSDEGAESDKESDKGKESDKEVLGKRSEIGRAHV